MSSPAKRVSEGDRVGVFDQRRFYRGGFGIYHPQYHVAFFRTKLSHGKGPESVCDNANANSLELEELTSLFMERQQRYYQSTSPPLLLCESGGAQGIADLKVCVMDGAAGGNVGHSLTMADLLVIHKMDLVEAEFGRIGA